MQQSKFKNRHLVSCGKQEVMSRIYEMAGTTNKSDIARQLGVTPSYMGNWASEKSKREIPLEFIVDFCIHFGVSIDYILTGKEPQQVVKFTGSPTVSMSAGAQQITGFNVGNGANIASLSQSHPGMERLLRILDHYGSPALFVKIEKMILEMYGEDYPVNLPKVE